MAPKSTTDTETRRRILTAALECFQRNGYNKTTMDEIAAASETSKGTLYWYFDSKDELLQAAMLSVFETTFGEETLHEVLALPSAVDTLRALVEMMTELADWAEGLFTLFLEFWASSPDREVVASMWVGMLTEYKKMFVGVIERGIAQGEFRPTDAEAIAWAMMAAYDGLAAYALLKPDLDLPRISIAFMETMLRGLLIEADGLSGLAGPGALSAWHFPPSEAECLALDGAPPTNRKTARHARRLAGPGARHFPPSEAQCPAPRREVGR